jgi:choline dehydrogenase
LPFFQKSPAFTPPNYSKLPPGDNVSYDPTAFDPTGGPLQVSYSNYRQPIIPFIENAFITLGVKSIPGLNSGNLIGYSRFTSTIDPKDETRSSSETSFLRNAIATSSLQIYHNTMAKRILFDKRKAATGVEVMTNGDSYVLSAKKEVILAAGVVSTVQDIDPKGG